MEVDAVGRQDVAYPEKIQGDTGEHHHGEVGQKKEEDPLHRFALQGAWKKERWVWGGGSSRGAGPFCAAGALDGSPGPS